MYILLIGTTIVLAPLVLFLIAMTLFLVLWVGLASYQDKRNLKTTAYGASLLWFGLFVLLPYYALIDYSNHRNVTVWGEVR